jgi:RNA polymerase sigma-70 factor (ECF subfamily)
VETRPARPEEALERFRRHGEPEAFGALFDATAPELHRVALALTKDPATADDVVQETYVAALRLLPRFERGRPVMPWLVALLQRRLQHARRAERRARARVAAVAAARGDGAPGAEAPADEERAALFEALEGLEEPYRGVALLRWRYGLLPIDIARVRGEPAGTTRSLLSRAAERLRARFPGALPAALAGEGGGLAGVRARVVAEAHARPARPAPPAPRTSSLPSPARLAVGAALLALAVGGGVSALPLAGDVPAGDDPAAERAARGEVVPGLAAASGTSPSPRDADPPGADGTREDAPAPVVLAGPWHSPADHAALPAERVPLRVAVVDRWGAAVPHARLRAMWGEWGTGVASTDAEGRAELRVPRGTRSLEVVGAGPEEKRRFLFVHFHPLVGRPAETRVVLRTGAQIAGRVVTADGTPVRGARVRAIPTAYGFGAVSTDANGRFRLDVLEAEAVDVRFDGVLDGDAEPRPADAPPLCGVVRDVVPERTGEVTVVAEEVPRDRDLLVRVFGPDGVPEPGARVQVNVTGVERAHATSDPDGRAVVTGLPDWPCDVVVTPSPRAGRCVLDGKTLHDVRPGRGLVAIRLSEVAWLRGRVVDAAGKPVAKAWCAAFAEGGWYVACFPSDEDGRFDVPSNVAPGTRLQVTARFPMESPRSRGVVDGVVAGASDVTVVVSEFR